ncbi:MAG: DUF72 domain-containing protein [Pseudomonadales bacterium]|nr:DUF72 domain-containing protein [Pseudomonadales bacterium]
MDTIIRAGTSGFSYKEWRGHFYPEDLPQDQWLTYYADQLPTVEINNTFYRMPKSHVVEAWRNAVPDNFRFVIKASRRITHIKRLNDAAEPTEFLLKATSLLGDKLGAVLFQCPPNMRENLDRLEAFLELLPEGYPAAFEFRHESWDSPETSALLAAHKHARVVAHGDDEPLNDIPKSDFVYLRLRATQYTPASLTKWHNKVDKSGASRAFVFFKHEDAGAGPKMAQKFLQKSTARKAPQRAPRKVTTRKRKAN